MLTWSDFDCSDKKHALIDVFASAALTGILAEGSGHNAPQHRVELAKRAYEIAIGMVEEREALRRAFIIHRAAEERLNTALSNEIQVTYSADVMPKFVKGMSVISK